MDYRQVLQTGTVLDGKYRIERVIGSGGFGITYEAFDIGLAAPVAIKEYYPSQFGIRDATYSVRPRTERDRELFERLLASFLREARTLNQFEHPAIVRVLSVFEAYGTAYMVMKYETGPSLKSWLASLVRLPTQNELDRLTIPLLDALETMHNAEFLHRDIAPDNIIVRADGNPVLLDFGASRRIMGEMTGTLTGVVKKGYSPQEQYATDSRSQGPWTDIYALGATLYRCISGETPYEATERMLDDHIVPAVEAGAGRYREPFLAAIDAAMVLRPKQRPQSIAEWREMLFEGVLVMPGQPQSWPTAGRSVPSNTDIDGGEDGTRHWGPTSQPRSEPNSRPRSTPSFRASGAGSEPAAVQTNEGIGISQPVAANDATPSSRRNMTAVAMAAGVVVLIGGGALFLSNSRENTRATPVQTAFEDVKRASDNEARRLNAEEESRRSAEAARQRQAAEEADATRRRAEDDARRLAEESRQRQLAEEARQRKLADEAEARRLAEVERQRVAALELQQRQERERLAREEASRKQADDERRRLAARPRQLAFAAPGANSTSFPVAVMTNASLIVAGGSDGTLKVWDATTGAPRELRGPKHADTISSVAVSPDGQWIVSGAWGGEIIVWSVNGTAQRFRAADAGSSTATGRRWVVATKFTTSTRFISVMSDGAIQTWDTNVPGNAVAETRVKADQVKSAAISSLGLTVATGNDSGAVELFRGNDGQPIRTLPGHQEWVLALAFASDTTTLGSGASDGEVRIFNTASPDSPLVRAFKAHDTAVRAISFSADGRRLASGAEDGTVTVWDVTNGGVIATYREHRNAVRSVTLSPDGQRIVSASEDGDVRIWYLDASAQALGPSSGGTSR